MPNKYGNARVLKPGVLHGTTAGYWREKNRGIPVCDECRAAWNAACVDYNARTGRTRRPKPEVPGSEKKPRFNRRRKR